MVAQQEREQAQAKAALLARVGRLARRRRLARCCRATVRVRTTRRGLVLALDRLWQCTGAARAVAGVQLPQLL
eukprot:3652582-Prymnesium_polylepis.1